MFRLSRPMFSMLVLTPAADNKISASRVISPVAVFTVAFTPSPLMSAFSTEDEVITSIPFFLKDFSSSLEISASSTGTILSMNSTIVTLVPNAL
ncbi:hypothetical protein D9M68_891380 [compost metagenome]